MEACDPFEVDDQPYLLGLAPVPKRLDRAEDELGGGELDVPLQTKHHDAPRILVRAIGPWSIARCRCARCRCARCRCARCRCARCRCARCRCARCRCARCRCARCRCARCRCARCRCVAVSGIVEEHNRSREPRTMQQVEGESIGQHAAGFDRSHAVAPLVERRAEHPDAELARRHCHQTAGDSALGRAGPPAAAIRRRSRTSHRSP